MSAILQFDFQKKKRKKKKRKKGKEKEKKRKQLHFSEGNDLNYTKKIQLECDIYISPKQGERKTSSGPVWVPLMAHNWQRWKSTVLLYPYHKIYRVEVVCLKRSNYTFKITIFVSMWNLGQFREKIDILSITAWLKFESKNPFAHMWRIWLWLTTAHHILFLLNRFSIKFRFSF